MLRVDSGVHVSTNEDCRTLFKCYGSAAKNKNINKTKFRIQTGNLFDLYEDKDYSTECLSHGNCSPFLRSNFSSNNTNDNETKPQARRDGDYDDTGYASAMEGE